METDLWQLHLKTNGTFIDKKITDEIQNGFLPLTTKILDKNKNLGLMSLIFLMNEILSL
jgi:hypothetical protein